MNLTNLLLNEFKSEASNTRRMLQRVSTEHFAWRPHEKSWTLAQLAQHIANLPTWVAATLDHDELDFAVPIPKAAPVADNAALLSFFEANLEAAVARLTGASDDEMTENWTMRSGDKIFFTHPKHIVLRNFVLNHTVHHRGQLSVNLRLLNIPLPGMYGPTADEKTMGE